MGDEGKTDYDLVIVEAEGFHTVLILYTFKIFHQKKFT